MTKYPMTEVMARREYQYSGPPSPQRVVAAIGRPAPMPDAPYGDWYCPYVLEAPGGRRESYAGGVDGLQALLLALSALKADLELLQGKGKLTFLDDEDLGIHLVGGAA